MSFFSKIMVPLRWIINHKYLFVTVVFLTIVLLIDDKSMLQRIGCQNKIADLNAQIEEMTRDSIEIEARNSRLEEAGNLYDVEKLAREKYSMHTPQEEIYVIE